MGGSLTHTEFGRHGPPAIEGGKPPYAHCLRNRAIPRINLTLPKFVLKTTDFRFGVMILDAGQGARKRRGRSVLVVREGATCSEATQHRAKSIRQIYLWSRPEVYASFNAGDPFMSPACHTPNPIMTPFSFGFSRQSRNPFSDDTTLSIFPRSESAAVIMK